MCYAVLSHSAMSNSLQTARLLCPWGFSRQEYWSGLPCPSPGIFPTQGSNLGLPHCRWILYYLSHLESPYDPAIPPLGMFPKKIKTLIRKDICTLMFTVVLFTIAKIWKQPVSIDR